MITRSKYGYPIVGNFIEVCRLRDRPRDPVKRSVGFILHFNKAHLRDVLASAFEMIFKPNEFRFAVEYPDLTDLVRAIEEVYPGTIKTAINKERLATGDFSLFKDI